MRIEYYYTYIDLAGKDERHEIFCEHARDQPPDTAKLRKKTGVETCLTALE